MHNIIIHIELLEKPLSEESEDFHRIMKASLMAWCKKHDISMEQYHIEETTITINNKM